MLNKLLGLLFFMMIGIITFSQKSPNVEAWKQKHQLSDKHFSIVVQGIGDEAHVFAHRPEALMTPASTQKIISTALALETFGPDKQFSTEVFINAPIAASRLKGDLIILGNGDMSLGSRYFDADFQAMWLDSLRKKGIKTIEGDIIAASGRFDSDMIPNSWAPEDIGNYYGAGSHGLTLGDNLFELHFMTEGIGSKATLLQVKPKLHGIDLSGEVRVEAIDYDNCYIYGAPYEMQRKMTGSLPPNRSRFVVRASLPNPEYQLVHTFKAYLQANGIQVLGEAKNDLPPKNTDWKLLFEHKGQRLEDILYWTNMKSVNLFAEQFAMHVVEHRFGTFEYDSLAFQLREILGEIGLESEGLQLVDGSGLSRQNLLKASVLNALLQRMHQSPHAEVFIKSLPVAARSGSLASMFVNTAAEGKIRAKSGSFKGVRSYAGYLQNKTGKEHSFAVIVNHPSKSGAEMRRAIEDLLLQFY